MVPVKVSNDCYTASILRLSTCGDVIYQLELVRLISNQQWPWSMDRPELVGQQLLITQLKLDTLEFVVHRPKYLELFKSLPPNSKTIPHNCNFNDALRLNNYQIVKR